MREEVLVLPPSAERRKAAFCLSKTDEAAFSISRKCVAPEATYVKRASHATGVRRDLKSEEASLPVSAEKMQTESSRREDHIIAPISESGKHEINEEGRGKQLMRSSFVYQSQKEVLQIALPLQWGSLKRSRGIRGPNHQTKPCSLVDESKAVRMEARKESSAATNSNAVAMEDLSKSKNAVSRKRDHPCSPPAEQADVEEDSKREKRLRSSDLSKGKRGVSVQGGKREEHAPHQFVTRSSPGKKLESPNEVTFTNGIGTGPARNMPKFVIALSRNEIEEDFLIFKGSKLPKRPKRRPRVVENATYYCTPGTGLSDVTFSRYTVKEKKNAKGKSRGLKAMESEETDSE